MASNLGWWRPQRVQSQIHLGPFRPLNVHSETHAHCSHPPPPAPPPLPLFLVSCQRHISTLCCSHAKTRWQWKSASNFDIEKHAHPLQHGPGHGKDCTSWWWQEVSKVIENDSEKDGVRLRETQIERNPAFNWKTQSMREKVQVSDLQKEGENKAREKEEVWQIC